MRSRSVKAELRDAVRRALGEQPTLAEFSRAVQDGTHCPVELRGANPTLDRSRSSQRDMRLYRLDLRRAFWIRLVNGWEADFAALADEQSTDLLAHLWRGLVGRRLAKAQRPELRALATQTGIVEAAKAMCAAVNATPDGTPDEVFGGFRRRCNAAIEERRRQGLPAPVVKRPRRSPALDLDDDWMLKALGIGVHPRSPQTWEEFRDTFPGKRSGDSDGAGEPAFAVSPPRQTARREPPPQVDLGL